MPSCSPCSLFLSTKSTINKYLQRRYQRSPLLSDSDGEGDHSSSPSKRKKQPDPSAPVKIDLPAEQPGTEEDEEGEEIPKEPLKTLVSALFLATGFVATTSSLAITHESVPDIGRRMATVLLVLLIRVLFDPRVFEFEFFPCPNHSRVKCLIVIKLNLPSNLRYLGKEFPGKTKSLGNCRLKTCI